MESESKVSSLACKYKSHTDIDLVLILLIFWIDLPTSSFGLLTLPFILPSLFLIVYWQTEESCDCRALDAVPGSFANPTGSQKIYGVIQEHMDVSMCSWEWFWKDRQSWEGSPLIHVFFIFGLWLLLWFTGVLQPWKQLCNTFQTDRCAWICFSSILEFL